MCERPFFVRTSIEDRIAKKNVHSKYWRFSHEPAYGELYNCSSHLTSSICVQCTLSYISFARIERIRLGIFFNYRITSSRSLTRVHWILSRLVSHIDTYAVYKCRKIRWICTAKFQPIFGLFLFTENPLKKKIIMKI